MEENPNALEASFRTLIAEARNAAPTHPSAEELDDYRFGDLSPEERERIQDHLAVCRQCVGTRRDFQALPDAPPIHQRHRASEEEMAALWERIREASGLALAPSLFQRFTTMLASPRFAYAMAAVFCLAAVVLALRIVSLRQTPLDRQPRGGVFLSDLIPREVILREEGNEDTTRVPPWSDRFLWILNLNDPRAFPGYRAEIADADGRTLWRSQALEKSPLGNFAVEIPRHFLPAGRYQITVYGIDRDPTELATYLVRLEYD